MKYQLIFSKSFYLTQLFVLSNLRCCTFLQPISVFIFNLHLFYFAVLISISDFFLKLLGFILVILHCFTELHTILLL